VSEQVRLLVIEALARRAAAHQGEVRRILDDKLAALEAQAPARGTDAGMAPAAGPQGQAGPLAQLVAYVAQQRGPAASLPSAASGELETLRYLRSTWSRLSADKRLTQSLAKVPDKAGPLNSHQLVHRALQAMRDASPEYFHHFVSYVDALMSLEQRSGASAASAAAEKASPAPTPRQRKGTRGK